MSLHPSKVVAGFDSASVTLRSLARALAGRPLPRLGQGRVASGIVRSSGVLPERLRRAGYARLGPAEALDPRALHRVDDERVAAWMLGLYPRRPHPGLVVGASNGAAVHLLAAAGLPWLPATYLVPVALDEAHDPHEVAAAAAFGREHGPVLLDANPGLELHHMHDPNQDELMVGRMAYFPVKRRRLPQAAKAWAEQHLDPGAPVVVLDDTSTWPTTRVGERHHFQLGAQGGLDPEDYVRDPRLTGAPAADGESAEAEWGTPPSLVDDVVAWAHRTGRPVRRVTYPGPEALSARVAEALRDRWRAAGVEPPHVLVESFVLLDTLLPLSRPVVPWWSFFPVEPSAARFEDWFGRRMPGADVGLTLFPHGVRSAGVAGPDRWTDAVAAAGGSAHLLGAHRGRFPSDAPHLARYAGAARRWAPPVPPDADLPPVTVDDVVTALRGADGIGGVSVVSGRRAPRAGRRARPGRR